MICADIMKIDELNKLRLIAGQKGLYRHIRWLYFADSMRVVDEGHFEDPEKYGHWIQGGELMVITNEAIITNDHFVEQLIFNSKEKCAAGLIVQKDKCTDFLMNLANEKDIPIFELPWEIRLIDLSQIITTMIINEKNRHTSLESILSTLLYGRYESEEEMIQLASSYQVDLKQEGTLVKCAFQANQNSYDQIESLMNLCRNVFDNIGYRHILILPETKNIFVLFPSEAMKKEQIHHCFEEISTFFMNKEKKQIKVGISSRIKKLSQYSEALKQANLAESLAQEDCQFVQFYDDLGILKVIASISNKEILTSFYQETLGPLEMADQLSDGCLCETLSAYLENNCNALIASQKLFIHRNTMRYRLNKIEEILNISLNDMHQVFLIQNAFAIKRYLDLLL